MTGSLEERIARLEAAQEIRHLKARYAEVCDTGYVPDRMVPLFTRDAVWDGGDRFGRYEGIDAIYRFFDGVSSQITWALHYMIAPLIEVAGDGETATGRWYLLEPCTLVTDDGPRAMLITGTYADRYRRASDGWKFSEVALDVQTITPLGSGSWNE